MKTCTKCNKQQSYDQFAKHKRYADGHLNQCFTCRREYAKAHYEANKERRLQQTSEYSRNNRDRRVVMARELRKRKPHVYVAYVQTRRARIKQAIPSWDRELTDLAMLEAAHVAKLRRDATGIDWHVDHIVPLVGLEVCGLHVWNNFQVIPAVINVRKANRLLSNTALEEH